MIFAMILALVMQAGSPVKLSWTPSTSQAVTSQILCRSTSPGTEDCSKPLVTFNDNTTSTYTDNSVQSGVAYYYVAEACAGTSCSVPSNEATNQPAAPNLTVTPK